MPTRAAEYVVLVARGEQKGLHFCVDLFIHKKGLSVKHNRSGEDMIHELRLGAIRQPM